MNRRLFLAELGALSTAFAGCLNEQTAQGNERTGKSSIPLVVSNATTDRETVQCTVATDAETVFAEQITVDADGRRTVATGIDEQGAYELTATISDGPSDSFPFSVDEYALKNQSRILVNIYDSRITVMMEE